MLSKLRKTRETGFTLIELLTVVIIIGVLAAIAIPVFSAQRSRAQDSQTISDVRNIVTAAESLLSDRTKNVSDLSQASLEYTSSNHVLWNISGNTTTGGYCVAAFNASGKDYKTTSTLLTYDSTAGGLKKSGGSCGTTTAGVAGANGSVTPTPTSSTGVGSDTVRNAVAPTNASASRNGNNGAISWTTSADSNVTGYAVQRSDTANGTFTTVGTVTGRATTTYTDTTAVAANTYYYRVASMVGSGTSTLVSNTATLTPTNTVFTATSAGKNGSFQYWTVPATGIYTIETYGASGGNYTNQNGGVGAYTSARYSLNAGDNYIIVVGQRGTNSDQNIAVSQGVGGGGGGGGTFIYINGASQPLQVSGGGGGAGYTNGDSASGSSVGNNGGAGGRSGSSDGANGGAGWTGNGYTYVNGSQNGPSGGYSRTNSWIGGDPYSNSTGAYGGFGGGGGGGWSAASGGGGGGYSGGHGGNYDGTSGGSSGTSYTASGATNVTVGSSSYSNGNGAVVITRVS